MCGIFGIFNNRVDIELLKSYCNKAKWRGPDSTNFYNGDNFFLGFHRLAINGLDEKSNQPFNINNKILICNGEIYNFKELALKLNISLETNSDCEIIIYLYEKFGIEYTLNLLDGVFAFILIDNDKNQVFACRDPFGVRPMFISYEDNGEIGFASEMKQLVNFDLEILKQVEPGCYYKLDLNKEWELSSLTRYNNFNLTIVDSKLTQEYNENSIINEGDIILENIRGYFIDAVKKRVETTDRPIACLLSGGLDSSIVACLVSKFYKGKLETYSIGLEGSEDLKYARIVAEAINSKHTEIIFEEQDFLNAIEEVIEAIESYDTTTVRASVGNLLVAEYIKENSDAKVIFNGDGSDELMGGYLYINNAPNSIEFDKECKNLLKNIHFFDALRSDRSISSRGLEARTPFLDRNFVNYYLSIPTEIRYNSNKNIEKFLFRKAFSNFLPDDIIWRKKEAFSDGVSKKTRSWYKIIQEFVNTKYLKKQTFSINNPDTLEKKYYREIFEKYYNGQGHVIPYFWMPKYIEAEDPSARTLSIYNKI